MEINSNKDALEQRKVLLKKEREENKRIEISNELLDR
jgi:hypothetical protein